MHGRQVELNLVDCSMLESVHVYELSFANLPHSVWRQFASHQATTWSPKAKVSKPWFLVVARRLPYLLYVFDNARGGTGLMFLSFIWKIWGFLSNHRCYSSNVLIDMYTLPQLCDTTRLFKIKLKVNPISNVFLQQTLSFICAQPYSHYAVLFQDFEKMHSPVVAFMQRIAACYWFV